MCILYYRVQTIRLLLRPSTNIPAKQSHPSCVVTSLSRYRVKTILSHLHMYSLPSSRSSTWLTFEHMSACDVTGIPSNCCRSYFRLYFLLLPVFWSFWDCLCISIIFFLLWYQVLFMLLLWIAMYSNLLLNLIQLQPINNEWHLSSLEDTR